MPYQNISASLSDTQRLQIIQHLKDAETIMAGFLINLTPEERQSLPKMSDKSLSFVQKALAYAQSNPQFVPPYANIPELQKDFGLASQLALVSQAAHIFTEKVGDTGMAVGSEAYVAALTIYNTVGQAAKVNVPGADTIYQDLKQRFPGGPRHPKPPTP